MLLALTAIMAGMLSHIELPAKFVADSPLDPEQYRWHCPYADIPPRNYRANLEFRRKVIARAKGDRHYQREQWRMCRRDPLYWINTYGWIYEPRSLPPTNAPRHFAWVTWSFQDEFYPIIAGSIGLVDVGADKSRDMAVSWGCLTLYCWQMQFYDDRTFLVVSRNEDQVDGDKPGTLMWKMRYIFDRQPDWMRPRYESKFLEIKIPETNSRAYGSATTGDLGRGDRFTSALLDEFPSFNDRQPGIDKRVQSALRDTTRSRIYVGTPKGAANEHYKLMHEPERNIVRLRLHWTRHDTHARGLYRTIGNRVELLDTAYQFPPDYKFRLPSPERIGGDWRSPYYDYECMRAGSTNESIEQELDIGYHGSDFPFFSMHKLDEYREKYGAPPAARGELEFDPFEMRPLRFRPNAQGRLLLWLALDDHGNPPANRDYVAAADISMGTGASNSALAIGDKRTRRVVAEFVTPHLAPHDFADYAAALLRWFGKALICWESNGPGRAFEKRIMGPRCRYWNVWFRDTDAQERRVFRTPSQIPGFPTAPESKKLLYWDLRAALDEGSFITPSLLTIEEARDIKTMPDQTVQHAAAVAGEDPTGARSNHGDRVFAAAMLNKLLGPFCAKTIEQPEEIPSECVARWRKDWARKRGADRAIALPAGW